ncbi:MAG: methyltransferase domain-containing protein, partial [Bacteroidales bacterium]
MFQCKYFAITDLQSSMKVGTDAVVLGAWVEVGKAKCILDVGCGCGIISLLMAQKTQWYPRVQILGIDMDAHSCQDALTNFTQSPWVDRLRVKTLRFQDLDRETNYDLIVSNPPFFSHSLHGKDEKRTYARHNDRLSFEALCQGVSQRLCTEGRFCLILPTTEYVNFENAAAQFGLHIYKRTFVSHTIHSKPKRILYELGLKPKPCEENHCFLYNK